MKLTFVAIKTIAPAALRAAKLVVVVAPHLVAVYRHIKARNQTDPITQRISK